MSRKIIDQHTRLPRKIKSSAPVQTLVPSNAAAVALLKSNEEAFRESVLAEALQRKATADAIIASATDPLELARGREMLKSAQWDMEKVCRRVWGNEMQVNVSGPGLDLGERLRVAEEMRRERLARARERVFDPAEVVTVEASK